MKEINEELECSIDEYLGMNSDENDINFYFFLIKKNKN